MPNHYPEDHRPSQSLPLGTPQTNRRSPGPQIRHQLPTPPSLLIPLQVNLGSNSPLSLLTFHPSQLAPAPHSPTVRLCVNEKEAGFSGFHQSENSARPPRKRPAFQGRKEEILWCSPPVYPPPCQQNLSANSGSWSMMVSPEKRHRSMVQFQTNPNHPFLPANAIPS